MVWARKPQPGTRNQKPETGNRKLLVAALALALALVSSASALADGLDDETRAIAQQLQCPVCQNLTVADSPAELAQEMRAIIRKKLAAGESREAIVQYFVDRYGENILTNPPKTGFTLGIWLGPLVGLAVGALMVFAVYRSRRAPAPAPAADEADVEAYEAALAEDLRRYREGTSP